ncbi:MAG: hypothetical protein KIH62_001975 [Candidatus Kerfeldbacteria bacterium]|nr:hypothetical protein [Candidatus Kerfeldbacteria bacterium]
MDIPLYIFLIPYGAIIIFIAVWSLFCFYHLVKFGFFDFVGRLNALLFIGLCVIVIGLTIFLLKNVPWLESISSDTLLPGITDVFDPPTNY